MQWRRASSRWRYSLIAGVLLAGLTISACGDDDDDDDDGNGGGGGDTGGGDVAGAQQIGEVDVLGIWGAEELTNFEAMVQPWVDDTGGDMNFTGTRNITADLTLRVEGGNPPDVAIPAEVGLFQQFAREGLLTPLSACEGLEDYVRDNYPESFIELGTVDGELYGFFMKADTKGTVWYNPAFFEENNLEPLDEGASFDDLVSLSEQIASDTDVPPWSIGMEQAEASGFPGSDWIQQIILNEVGEDVYDGLIDGSIEWTDERVRGAWEQFGEIALAEGFTVQGGGSGINATAAMASSYPPFESPPTAAMVYLGGFAAGFITDQFPDAQPGETFDFFPFPGGKVTGGANIVYAFNSEPTTCSYLTHLASAEAQQIWVDAGGFTSVNSEVSMDAYPDDVARKQAEQLLEAETFRFDLDDAIGGDVQTAIFQGVTQYLSNPDQLEQILESIQATTQ
jgi:alpha-glucoside transport system substrate-binding protein